MSVPAIILEALKRQPRPGRGVPEGPVSRGDIRLIDWPGHDTMRSVLVVSVDSSDGVCEVLLLHSIVDYMTDFDILIPRAESGLSYALVAQLDIRCVVWTVDLGKALGRLSHDLDRFSIVAAANEDLRNGRGLKLSGPRDPRWQFKGEEGRALAEITESCTAAMLSGDRTFAVSPESRWRGRGLCASERNVHFDRLRLWFKLQISRGRHRRPQRQVQMVQQH
jgi:hypothetical protein